MQNIFVFIALVCLIPTALTNPINSTSSTTESIQSVPVNLTNEDQVAQSRQLFIKQMALDAWNAYSESAWGDEALQPQTNNSYEFWFGNRSGQTIVDSLSTLHIMGLSEEYEKGRKWVAEEMDFGQLDQDVRIYYAVTHYIGGLLSCYALTRDEMFLNKSRQISDLLEPVFNTSTGLPFYNVNPKQQTGSDARPFLYSILVQQPELIYLGHLTNDSKLLNRISNITQFIRQIPRTKKIHKQMLNVQEGKWVTPKSSLARTERDFFTNLLKSYIQSNGRDVRAIEMYNEAIDAVEENGLIATSNKSGLTFTREFDAKRGNYSDWMSFLSCYFGGMLSLGSRHISRVRTTADEGVRAIQMERINRHWQLGKNITETCYRAMQNTETKLAPWTFFFNENEDASNQEVERFNLGPELAESYFIHWRLTRDTRYRDYAWQMAQAIHSHCRHASGGYSDLNNVHTGERLNYQRPAFLSGTLKFLYLTFSNDSILPLDQWLFNTAGHPLPICGANSAYPHC